MTFRILTLAAALAAVTFGSSLGPTVQLQVNGQAVNFGNNLVVDSLTDPGTGKVTYSFSLNNDGTFTTGTLAIPGLFGTTNPDPAISWSVTFANTGNQSLALSLIITQPFILGPYGHMQNSASVSLSGTGSLSITNVSVQPLLNGNLLDGLTLGGNCTSDCTYPDKNMTEITGTSGTFGIKTAFTLAPGTTAGWSGNLVLDGTPPSAAGTVSLPEPTTFAMLGLGLALLLKRPLLKRSRAS